jgi:hypothetical protein
MMTGHLRIPVPRKDDPHHVATKVSIWGPWFVLYLLEAFEIASAGTEIREMGHSINFVTGRETGSARSLLSLLRKIH